MTPIMTKVEPDTLVGAPLFIPDEWLTTLPANWSPVVNRNDPLVYVGSLPGMADSGRFAALVAPLDACVLNGNERPGQCISPRMLMRGDNLEFANVATITASSGQNFKGGRIAGSMPHAPTFDALGQPIGARPTMDYYADTGLGFARGVYVMDYERGGLFVTGALDPGVTVWQALAVQASTLSGDWRWVEELQGYRFIAAQGVNVPGYRPALAASVRPGRYGEQYATIASVRPVLTYDGTIAAATTWESSPMCDCKNEPVAANAAQNVDGDGNPINNPIGTGQQSPSIPLMMHPEAASLKDIEALNAKLDEAYGSIQHLTEVLAQLVAENRQLAALPENGCHEDKCAPAEMNLLPMPECC